MSLISINLATLILSIFIFKLGFNAANREFLFGLSMITRGSLKEKIDFAFQVYDTEGTGYMSPESYGHFVRSIVQAARFSNLEENSPEFDQALANFEKKLVDIGKAKENINFIDIQNGIRSDLFVEQCSKAQEIRERGSTMANIKRSLDSNV